MISEVLNLRLTLDFDLRIILKMYLISNAIELLNPSPAVLFRRVVIGHSLQAVSWFMVRYE